MSIVFFRHDQNFLTFETVTVRLHKQYSEQKIQN